MVTHTYSGVGCKVNLPSQPWGRQKNAPATNETWAHSGQLRMARSAPQKRRTPPTHLDLRPNQPPATQDRAGLSFLFLLLQSRYYQAPAIRLFGLSCALLSCQAGRMDALPPSLTSRSPPQGLCPCLSSGRLYRLTSSSACVGAWCGLIGLEHTNWVMRTRHTLSGY